MQLHWNISFPLNQGDTEENPDLDKQKKSSEVGEDGEDNSDTENVESENLNSVEGGKKDPFLRRQELLVNSGLAEVANFTGPLAHLQAVFFSFT